MLKRIPWLLLTMTAFGSVVAASCGGDDTPAATATSAAPATSAASPTAAATATKAAAPTDLIALKKAPASLAADDAAWKDAKVTTVKTTVLKGTDAKTGVDASLQAVYSDTDIWFRAEWSDATQFLANQWTYDGTKWKAASGQQDRLALIWQVTPSADFQTKGCAATCHNPETDKADKWWMVSPPGSTMDLWQWTTGRSAGDGHLADGTLSNKVPEPTALGAPRVVDANTGGGNTADTNDAKDGPKMMQDPTKKPSLGPDFLLASEAVALDVSKLKAGDKVGRYLSAPFKGSAGDIDAKGAWANGKWTVVWHRKLDTGNPDDAKFAAGGSYPFGLALFNDLADADHTRTADVYTMKLQ